MVTRWYSNLDHDDDDAHHDDGVLVGNRDDGVDGDGEWDHGEGGVHGDGD